MAKLTNWWPEGLVDVIWGFACQLFLKTSYEVPSRYLILAAWNQKHWKVSVLGKAGLEFALSARSFYHALWEGYAMKNAMHIIRFPLQQLCTLSITLSYRNYKIWIYTSISLHTYHILYGQSVLNDLDWFGHIFCQVKGMIFGKKKLSDRSVFGWPLIKNRLIIPIGSMYAIFTYMVNVG